MTHKGIKIEGNVAPGFESVKTLFEKEMHTKAEDSAQLCVYHKGKKVVDLWASKNTGFSPDSLINIFSSGKTLEAISLAHRSLLTIYDLLNLPEKSCLYARVDLLFDKNAGYLISEVELIEPDLFLEYKKESLPIFCTEILNTLN